MSQNNPGNPEAFEIANPVVGLAIPVDIILDMVPHHGDIFIDEEQNTLKVLASSGPSDILEHDNRIGFLAERLDTLFKFIGKTIPNIVTGRMVNLSGLSEVVVTSGDAPNIECVTFSVDRLRTSTYHLIISAAASSEMTLLNEILSTLRPEEGSYVARAFSGDIADGDEGHFYDVAISSNLDSHLFLLGPAIEDARRTFLHSLRTIPGIQMNKKSAQWILDDVMAGGQ